MTRHFIGTATALLLALAAGTVSSAAPTAQAPSAATRADSPGSDAIVPFKIQVPDSVLSDLKAQARPDPIPG